MIADDQDLYDPEAVVAANLGVRYGPLYDSAKTDAPSAVRFFELSTTAGFDGGAGELYSEDLIDVTRSWNDDRLAELIDRTTPPTRRCVLLSIYSYSSGGIQNDLREWAAFTGRYPKVARMVDAERLK